MPQFLAMKTKEAVSNARWFFVKRSALQAMILTVISITEDLDIIGDERAQSPPNRRTSNTLLGFGVSRSPDLFRGPKKPSPLNQLQGQHADSGGGYVPAWDEAHRRFGSGGFSIDVFNEDLPAGSSPRGIGKAGSEVTPSVHTNSRGSQRELTEDRVQELKSHLKPLFNLYRWVAKVTEIEMRIR